jgi:hypothetical protein
MKHNPIHFLRVAKHIFAVMIATLVTHSVVASANDQNGAVAISSVRQAQCPSARQLQPLISLGSVYLGELHGTNEVPQLVGCLVDATIAAGIKPLTVSLELPDFARDTKSLTWSGPDGRTSKAMAKLVEHLEALESAHQITLDFQVTGYESSDDAMNHSVGMHLRDLASRSRVIALGGNFHSQRKNVLQPSFHVAPAGSYVGSDVKTVFVDSTGNGYAWFCAASCGEQADSSATAGGYVGQLKDGASVGHDYIYKIGPFTASSPAVHRPAAEPSR